MDGALLSSPRACAPASRRRAAEHPVPRPDETGCAGLFRTRAADCGAVQRFEIFSGLDQADQTKNQLSAKLSPVRPLLALAPPLPRAAAPAPCPPRLLQLLRRRLPICLCARAAEASLAASRLRTGGAADEEAVEQAVVGAGGAEERGLREREVQQLVEHAEERPDVGQRQRVRRSCSFPRAAGDLPPAPAASSCRAGRLSPAPLGPPVPPPPAKAAAERGLPEVLKFSDGDTAQRLRILVAAAEAPPVTVSSAAASLSIAVLDSDTSRPCRC
ncbi:uncharacterized protein LOC120694975 [Panicum virgatum]|uniref:uncharacterized protein LOC120694975 n=1 Tax=Panicum virgatum TaxID=38727 RepID=UPI0019D54703|nr:uncharacterized protein LOC120694975 [Panicum virgatum]